MGIANLTKKCSIILLLRCMFLQSSSSELVWKSVTQKRGLPRVLVSFHSSTMVLSTMVVLLAPLPTQAETGSGALYIQFNKRCYQKHLPTVARGERPRRLEQENASSLSFTKD